MDFLTSQQSANFTKNTFQSGVKLKIHRNEAIIKNIKLTNIISEEWRNRIRIRTTHTINKNIKQKYSIIWGDLIHNIMAGISTQDDIDNVINQFDIEKKYGLKTCDKIKQQILTIINNNKISHLFEKNLKIYSETSILAEDGKIYRPDRVVIHEHQEASLVDYKTGNKSSEHENQMYKYEDILIKLGFDKVDKYIVYLTTGDIKKI